MAERKVPFLRLTAGGGAASAALRRLTINILCFHSISRGGPDSISATRRAVSTRIAFYIPTHSFHFTKYPDEILVKCTPQERLPNDLPRPGRERAAKNVRSSARRRDFIATSCQYKLAMIIGRGAGDRCGARKGRNHLPFEIYSICSSIIF